MNYNVILHVDLNDAGRLGLAFTNATNYLLGLPEGAEAKVAIVVNGPAVNLFVKNPETKALEDTAASLIAKGVAIKLCNNAVTKFQLDRDAIWAGCEVIPAAMMELVQLQNEGYAYVKP